MLENNKLSFEHLEKMRALALRNINANYDRMAAHQKQIFKLQEEIMGKDMAKTFKDKHLAFQAEQLKFQKEFEKITKTEDEKFQAMMKPRYEQSAKPAAPASQPPKK